MRQTMAGLPDPWVVPLLSVGDAGRLLGMSERSAYRAAAAGDLPTVVVSGQRRVATADLYRLARLPIPARPGPPPVIYHGR